MDIAIDLGEDCIDSFEGVDLGGKSIDDMVITTADDDGDDDDNVEQRLE